MQQTAPDETSPGSADAARVIDIPDFCLLLLVGPTGSGKSTLARRLFRTHEILSSDTFREMVSGSADSAEATADAFAVLREVASRRLRRRLLTVVDATNLRSDDRRDLIALARAAYAPCVAALLASERAAQFTRNRERDDRRPRKALLRQIELARGAFKAMRKEGFTAVHRLDEAAIASVALRRVPLRTDRRHETGPFDVIGDVHGCMLELSQLLRDLGYRLDDALGLGEEGPRFRLSHPDGRRPVFVGDLADRGPASADTLEFVMDAVRAGSALCVMGNHDRKLLRHLRGKEQNPTQGFDLTLAQISSAPVTSRLAARLPRFLDDLPSHLVLDGGALAVAHAGVREAMLARASKEVMEFCVHGETTGEVDGFGLPVRVDWAADYAGEAVVAYGHVPQHEPRWVGKTICLDTGCVFGGALTALRWPEREIVSVPASREWSVPSRPLVPAAETMEANAETGEAAGLRLSDAASLLGKRQVETRFGRPVSVDAERSAAAFEALARHCADPRWLVFIPPTTAAVEASATVGWLERPEEAFAHYANAGVGRVSVQEKHMGSRAVVVACRDEAAAARRFAADGCLGAVTTKSGHPFFADLAEEGTVVGRVRDAIDRAGLWDSLDTDWLVLDGEMLPWIAKARGLITGTFATAGAAGSEASRALREAATRAAARGVEGTDRLVARAADRVAAMAAYRNAYRPFVGGGELKFAPFHVLAAEGKVFVDQPHDWHMRVAARLAEASDGFVIPTKWRDLDPADMAQVADATAWWEKLCAEGREGFVVKGPGLAPQGKGQAPAVKVRGREYLRLIYGPEYDRAETLPGLKKRATGRKRTLARVGMSLGLEGLSRLAEGASLARVHEAVAASLAVASEPIDARL